MAVRVEEGGYMRVKTLTASYLLDWILGDPEFLPHPVRLIGKTIAAGERTLRRPGSGPAVEFIGGLVLTGGIVAGSAVAVSKLLRALRRLGPSRARVVEIWLVASCLATRNLLDEARSVLQTLEEADLERARLRLSRIVGRDTAGLDSGEIVRAVIETLAESLCDGVIAPLTYLVIGGVPMAMAYKAVNTLDSMIGHRDEDYEWFGKASARLDDAANFLPARIAALLVCGACAILGPGHTSSAWKTWRLDSLKLASPNAGQTESAMAGALRVQLGGVNMYDGERVETALLGSGFPGPEVHHVRKAMRITALASVLGFAVGCLILSGRRHG
jgi:adenosylcobinamide-phosphate synthase